MARRSARYDLYYDEILDIRGESLTCGLRRAVLQDVSTIEGEGERRYLLQRDTPLASPRQNIKAAANPRRDLRPRIAS